MLSTARPQHVSTYLSTELLKRIEEVRTGLFIQHNHKLTKADLIERALRLGLENPEKLIKE